MDLWLDVDRDQIEEVLTAAERRLASLTAEALGVQEAIRQLNVKVMRYELIDKGIRVGDRVIIDYENGPVECIFEGVESHWRGLGVRLVTRAFTKRGKPCKQADRFDGNLGFVTRVPNPS